MKFTAVFEEVGEGYIAFVEELPGANTQGATLEEGRAQSQGSGGACPGGQPDAGWRDDEG